jgi:hypothetical protein
VFRILISRALLDVGFFSSPFCDHQRIQPRAVLELRAATDPDHFRLLPVLEERERIDVTHGAAQGLLVSFEDFRDFLPGVFDATLRAFNKFRIPFGFRARHAEIIFELLAAVRVNRGARLEHAAERSAHHHDVRTQGQGFAEIRRPFDAPVDAEVVPRVARHLFDQPCVRAANAGHTSGGAGAARADAVLLNQALLRINEALHRFGRAEISGHQDVLVVLPVGHVLILEDRSVGNVDADDQAVRAHQPGFVRAKFGQTDRHADVNAFSGQFRAHLEPRLERRVDPPRLNVRPARLGHGPRKFRVWLEVSGVIRVKHRHACRENRQFQLERPEFRACIDIFAGFDATARGGQDQDIIESEGFAARGFHVCLPRQSDLSFCRVGRAHL